MKVLKFGGTSVGTVESLRNVKHIVESIEEPVIVVVSALGGLTDRLIATARLAEASDIRYVEELDSMIKRHKDIVDALVPESGKVELLYVIDSLFGKLSNIYKGIYLLEELSVRSLDKVVSFGERLSSRIISKIINDAELFDAIDFIKTINRYGRHYLDNDLSSRLIHRAFDERDFKVAVVPGFISTDSKDVITNLGRGGSDYTAAILAATLDADVLEIWTDVDGFMTADPRIVKGTHIIPSLSFTEAMELCNFGAKVIYPPTIYPVFHKNIPIFIKNTFNPSVAGTCIHDVKAEAEAKTIIKGVSSITDTCLIHIRINNNPDEITSRALNTLARNGISVLLVSNPDGPETLTFSLPVSDVERASESLDKEFSAEFETGEISPLEVESQLATIAVVADQMRGIPNLSERISQTLEHNSIMIRAKSQSVQETSLAFVVPMNQRIEALQAVHDEIFA